MLRAIWFLIQVSLIVAAAIWVAERPGTVVIAWMEYTLTIQVGMFLLCLAGLVFVSLLIHRFVLALLNLPKTMMQFRQGRVHRRGLQALTRGFVAVAAGDVKKATKYARDTRLLLPDEYGLPLLLEAQAARLRGEEGKARLVFEELLKDKDASFFGIRGLLKSSLDAGQNDQALGFAHQALSEHPKQGWILKTVYDLEIRNRRWGDALATLKKAVRHGAIDKDKAASDEAAILVYQSDNDVHDGLQAESFKKLQRAYKINPYFIPGVTRLAARLIERNNTRKATRMVEEAWKMRPHPELIDIWDRLAPANKPNDPLRRLRWFEKLLDLNPDSIEGQLAVAQAAINDGLWDEAQSYLSAAEHKHASAQLYRMRAKIEEKTSHNETAVRHWLEKAADAPGDKVWICSETGAIYDRWSAIAMPHGSFNTIVWDLPRKRPSDKTLAMVDEPESLLLDPAA